MDGGADAHQSRFLGSPRHQPGLHDTALLVTDMQYLDAHPDYGLCRRMRDAGADLSYYNHRLQLATANIARLLAAFRARHMEVIYSRIESLTSDGRDRSLAHKTAGIHAPPGSRESMILEAITPADGEIVLSKTASSVFVGTIIDYVLRNIGISVLVVTGVVTSGCVEAAVRDAFDRNYKIVLVEDACADLVQAFHETAIDVLRLAAMVTTTKALIASLPAAAAG
ncbi:MAG: cysteine hydrolase [Ardenticatenaceae bacterium]|nr:cysteine hydrolase [Ardenticatenaceae bacterium]HBY96775.1 cysteine hydrolase [Chloroflexota bacterium]